MSWTYLSSAPGSSDLSWIRARIGDTSSGSALLSDEEINLFLSDYGNKYEAGAAAARSVGAQFARTATKEVGRLKISMTDASKYYFDLADSLGREADVNDGGFFAGGISQSDKKTQTDDSDWLGASFSRGQFENPGSASNTSDRNS
jgi:hypothetical protein